jgi:hypothetical protein
MKVGANDRSAQELQNEHRTRFIKSFWLRYDDDDDDDDGFINVSRGEHHCLIALALIAGTLIA